MKTLSTTTGLGNANRWRVWFADPIESQTVVLVLVQLISSNNALISEATLRIRNGSSDRVRIDFSQNTLPGALVVEREAVSTPTGYDDAFAAWKTPATQPNRRAALESWMLTATVADSTMAGT